MSQSAGGEQVISTYNGGNVVSTETASLNFTRPNVENLVKTISGIEPNMVNGVTLDNTFVSHQQYRYIPSVFNNKTIVWQFVTPNWCHVRDIAMNLQLIIRPLGTTWSQSSSSPLFSTRHKILSGGYHITSGGLLSIFQNMKIKMGSQVDIFTAFEKTKSAYHILNTWLRGTWDQRTVFALIDRWDAWYPSGRFDFYAFNTNITGSVGTLGTVANLWPTSYVGNDPLYMSKQSECHYERLLSRVLAQRGFLAVNDRSKNFPTRFNQIIENVSFALPHLHSLFQQNIMLPPGVQFIIETDLPIYPDYNPNSTPEPYPLNATWSNIGLIVPQLNYVAPSPFSQSTYIDDLSYKKASDFEAGPFIGVSVNNTSIFNCVTLNAVNLRPEIARSLQEERIKNPLIYNYSQMVATSVGKFFNGQTIYNFTLPPNQSIPTQFIFAWVNPKAYTKDNTNAYPGQLDCQMTNPDLNLNAYANGYSGIQAGIVGTTSVFDTPAMGGGDQYHRFYGSSFTPLPIPYKRIIVKRGGFQEIFHYGTYYDGLGNNIGAFSQLPSQPTENQIFIGNAVTLLGAKNITPDPSQKYFDHLEEYQWDNKSLNGLGPIERRLKYSYAPAMFTDGRYMTIQMNPCKNDIGQYSSDMNAYTVDVTIELDLDWPASIGFTGLNELSELICIRVLPAQMSLAIDGTVRQYVWPNLLVSPDQAISVNPPPAGPGGSI